MYPHLVSIGSFEITTFGAMVALAAMVGLWLFHREALQSGLPSQVFDAGLVGVVGGLVGAKLLWTIEHASTAPVTELLFSRGGLSWYGGLIGGVGCGLIYIRAKGWPIVSVVAAATPALAFGQALGRIGCFLVGDDYGWPTDLPWGVAFPRGLPPTSVPVHPTQLYEAIGLSAVGLLLLRSRRRGATDSAVLGQYLAAVGALRFAVEFLRVHEPLLFGLAPAHLLSLIAAGAGVTIVVLGARSARRGLS